MGNEKKNKFSYGRFNLCGFTLVELMAALIIFSIVAASVYSLINMSNIIFRSNDASARINEDGMQLLRTISREVEQSSATNRLVITPIGSNSVIRFQTPVDYDNDGDVVNDGPTNTVEWGAYDEVNQTQKGSGQNPFNRWVRYQMTSNQLIRDVLNSSLNPVNGLSRVVANNVQAFTVTQNQNTLTAGVTLQVADSVGQNGQPRNFQATVSQNIFLRNAGN